MSGRHVVFDFDGTLTYCDSFLLFLRFVCGARNFWLRLPLLLPDYLAYKIGLQSRDALKIQALTLWLSGREEEEVTEAGKAFAEQVLPELLNPLALRCLLMHQREGDRVTIVSASLESYLAPLALQEKVCVAATRLETREGKITGRLKGLNCYGPEKLCRFTELAGEPQPMIHTAYGDSKGDHALLAAAKEAHYQPFRDATFKAKAIHVFLSHLLFMPKWKRLAPIAPQTKHLR